MIYHPRPAPIPADVCLAVLDGRKAGVQTGHEERGLGDLGELTDLLPRPRSPAEPSVPTSPTPRDAPTATSSGPRRKRRTARRATSSFICLMPGMTDGELDQFRDRQRFPPNR